MMIKDNNNNNDDVDRWEAVNWWTNHSRWTASTGLPERREKVRCSTAIYRRNIS